MIGPTGVGKTEIARRLARLAQSPFLKVEVTKFTEVGYVGRDVESMIRDLTELAINMVKGRRKRRRSWPRPRKMAEERLLDLLLPPKTETPQERKSRRPGKNPRGRQKDRVRSRYPPGKNCGPCFGKESWTNALWTWKSPNRAIPMVEIFSNAGMEEMDLNLKEMFGNLFPKKTKTAAR